MIETFDPMDLSDPFGFYRWARSNSPIFHDARSGYWVLTKHKHIHHVLGNEHLFSAELDRVNYSDLSPEAREILEPIRFEELYGLSTTENPSHDRVKRVLLPLFNDLFIRNLKPAVEDIADGYVAAIKGERQVDMASTVFRDLPADVIFTVLGVPRADIPQVKEWSHSRMALTWGGPGEQARHAANIVKYWAYCRELISRKIEAPSDDLPSLLGESYRNGLISLREVELLCYGLIFSGHATTSAFLTESLRTLLASGTWRRILAESIPFAETVDELLRLCPSAFTRRRLVLDDVRLGELILSKGSELLLVIGSGNRDEDVFDRPDELILGRQNSHKHLALGYGFHYCIGAKIVKLEYAVVMNLLARNFPDLRLSAGMAITYHPNISIRSPDSLFVDLSG
jgi:cytochrome P450